MGSINFKFVLFSEIQKNFFSEYKINIEGDKIVAELAQKVENDIFR